MELTRLSSSTEPDFDEFSIRQEDAPERRGSGINLRTRSNFAKQSKSAMTPSSSLLEINREDPHDELGDQAGSLRPKSRFLHKTRARWKQRLRLLTAVQISFGIAVLVFIINLVLFLIGALKGAGYTAGLSFLHNGEKDEISRLSTAYHVLINILSTGLLTSSSYCMQLLCSPRREYVDAAHARGEYFNIGILSLRNMRFISRKRSIMALILFLSSIPLHLLYNSAIFEMTVGQNYTINFVNSSDTALVQQLAANNTKLENSEWQKLYSAKIVPNFGNINLVIDAVSLNIDLNTTDWTWTYAQPDGNTDYTWQVVNSSALPATPYQLSLQLSGSGTFAVSRDQLRQRMVISLEDYSNSTTGMTVPQYSIPEPLKNDITQTIWSDILPLNADSWTTPPFHIDFALSEPRPNTFSIQISLGFMLVVVICNGLKMAVIYWTLREPLDKQFLTFGDAVSSFLENPDPTTIGKCNLSKAELLSSLKSPSSSDEKPWKYSRMYVASSNRDRWLSRSFVWLAMIISVVIMISAVLTAIPISTGYSSSPGATGWRWAWASSSPLELKFIPNFSSNGILLRAWFANAPQLILSVAYFAINRLCTSICFTREWNAGATCRKGLRVTAPTGSQRPAYFLQLPYRWAIPLTFVSGLFHWLLSQSLFLVLFEIRDYDGQVIDSESAATVGYSNLSLLVFSVTYLLMLLVVAVLQLGKFTANIPPAEHCSLMISAACHPPPSDDSAHLQKVQWGVVKARFGAKVGHCSFTSEEVSGPEEGKCYS